MISPESDATGTLAVRPELLSVLLVRHGIDCSPEQLVALVVDIKQIGILRPLEVPDNNNVVQKSWYEEAKTRLVELHLGQYGDSATKKFSEWLSRLFDPGGPEERSAVLRMMSIVSPGEILLENQANGEWSQYFIKELAQRHSEIYVTVVRYFLGSRRAMQIPELPFESALTTDIRKILMYRAPLLFLSR